MLCTIYIVIKLLECVRRQQVRLGIISDQYGGNLLKSYYSDMKDVSSHSSHSMLRQPILDGDIVSIGIV